MIFIEWKCIQSTGRNPSGPEQSPNHFFMAVRLFAPEESHSFTNPYVVVIKVAETRKGDRGQKKEACSGQLDFRLSVNVVSHDLAQSPEREIPHRQFRLITKHAPFRVIWIGQFDLSTRWLKVCGHRTITAICAPSPMCFQKVGSKR